jgi:hypothetical protein
MVSGLTLLSISATLLGSPCKTVQVNNCRVMAGFFNKKNLIPLLRTVEFAFIL